MTALPCPIRARYSGQDGLTTVDRTGQCVRSVVHGPTRADTRRVDQRNSQADSEGSIPFTRSTFAQLNSLMGTCHTPTCLGIFPKMPGSWAAVRTMRNWHGFRPRSGLAGPTPTMAASFADAVMLVVCDLRVERWRGTARGRHLPAAGRAATC
jgi:hypothetical protein